MPGEYSIKVYTSHQRPGNPNNATFEVIVDTVEQVSDHIRQLRRFGYERKTDEDAIEWFSPNTILRVEATGPGLVGGYTDTDITPV